jgi:membrane protein DedA with SNARE-associated domain
VHFLTFLLTKYGYWGLFGALALEYLFIPVPGETTLTAAGIAYKSHHFHLSLFWLLTATTLGSFIGSMCSYFIGRLFGRPFLLRLSRILRLKPEKIDEAEAFFSKYTVLTLIISRYIAVVRIIVPYLAGMNHVPLPLYAATMLISSLAWTATFVVAGSVIEEAWHQFIHHWRMELIPALLIFIFVVIGYVSLHRWLNQRMKLHASSANSRRHSEKED